MEVRPEGGKHVSQFAQFVSETLADRQITEAEVPLIQARLEENGQLDIQDVRLLTELYCGARTHCRAFEELFFAVLEQVLLADGQIQPDEQYYLLKMLYSDREIRDTERRFLKRLWQRVAVRTPEFESLCDIALAAPSTNWSTGGR